MCICLNCGKETTNEKFCSRSCRTSYNNKHRVFSKQKREEINKKISQTQKQKQRINKPKYCSVCGNQISLNKKYRKTCSDQCQNKLRNLHHNHCGGGYRKGACKGKHGYYKGIYCDSTFELAYLIYCLDHNINIQRCQQSFEYEYEGKLHRYHPDFVVDDVIVQIKNFNSPLVDIKLKAVNKPIKIFYSKDLAPIFEYVATTYNKKFKGNKNNFYELYDRVM